MVCGMTLLFSLLNAVALRILPRVLFSELRRDIFEPVSNGVFVDYKLTNKNALLLFVSNDQTRAFLITVHAGDKDLMPKLLTRYKLIASLSRTKSYRFLLGRNVSTNELVIFHFVDIFK
jgi:hypothetical protein